MTDTDPIQCGKRKQCRQQCGIRDQPLFLIYQDCMWNIPFMCKQRPALQSESLPSLASLPSVVQAGFQVFITGQNGLSTIT